MGLRWPRILRNSSTIHNGSQQWGRRLDNACRSDSLSRTRSNNCLGCGPSCWNAEAGVPARVTDPFGAASDPALPSLGLALDPRAIEKEFKRGLPRLATERGLVQVKSATVQRYKPGRRCVIEYHVRVERPDAPRLRPILLGKVRARR